MTRMKRGRLLDVCLGGQSADRKYLPGFGMIRVGHFHLSWLYSLRPWRGFPLVQRFASCCIVRVGPFLFCWRR